MDNNERAAVHRERDRQRGEVAARTGDLARRFAASRSSSTGLSRGGPEMTTALERENVELRRRLEALHVRVLNLHRPIGEMSASRWNMPACAPTPLRSGSAANHRYRRRCSARSGGVSPSHPAAVPAVRRAVPGNRP